MKIDERTKKIVFTKMSRRQFEYILEDNTALTGFCRTRPDQDEWEEDHFLYYNNLGTVGEYKNGGGWMYPVNLLRKPEFESEELWSPWQHKSWRKV
tara:strand:+ start:95 stop:382 length:288 start_codon:yes stop_codon:yes gene_type:complete